VTVGVFLFFCLHQSFVWAAKRDIGMSIKDLYRYKREGDDYERDEFCVDEDEDEGECEEEVPITLGGRTIEQFRADLPVLKNRGGDIALYPSSIPNAGLGVFALRTFEKGEAITEYTGLLLSREEARSLPDKAQSHIRALFNNKWSVDGLRLADGTPIVDPQRQLIGLGIGAYVNDARGIQNNADFAFADSPALIQQYETEGVAVDKDPTQRCMFIIAKRRIRAYEEVFVPYGDAYKW
jgi:hypothetical protein